MTHAEQWKFIIDSFNKIPDTVLRREFIAEARKKAIEEWGFDPMSDTPVINKSDDDCVREYFPNEYAAIQSYNRFGNAKKLYNISGSYKQERKKLLNDYICELMQENGYSEQDINIATGDTKCEQ